MSPQGLLVGTTSDTEHEAMTIGLLILCDIMLPEDVSDERVEQVWLHNAIPIGAQVKTVTIAIEPCH